MNSPFLLAMEPLNKSSAAERRIFCPNRSVLKSGNTSSIPPISELSVEPKSTVVSSCRFIQSFPIKKRLRFTVTASSHNMNPGYPNCCIIRSTARDRRRRTQRDTAKIMAVSIWAIMEAWEAAAAQQQSEDWVFALFIENRAVIFVTSPWIWSYCISTTDICQRGKYYNIARESIGFFVVLHKKDCRIITKCPKQCN